MPSRHATPRRNKHSVSLFAIIMGIALLLTNTGLLVLTVRRLREPTAAPVKPVTA